mmetsp:Transcript_37669/g.116386  ORF Transcript_37669/g.116386 Transcript_37669/m.116386 type:complete len:203 (-) Transcript_37669:1478-2086(-)
MRMGFTAGIRSYDAATLFVGKRTTSMATYWKEPTTSCTVCCVASTGTSYSRHMRSSSDARVYAPPMAADALAASAPMLPTRQRPVAIPQRTARPSEVAGTSAASCVASVHPRRACDAHGRAALKVATKWSPWKSARTPSRARMRPTTRSTTWLSFSMKTSRATVFARRTKPLRFATTTVADCAFKPKLRSAAVGTAAPPADR